MKKVFTKQCLKVERYQVSARKEIEHTVDLAKLANVNGGSSRTADHYVTWSGEKIYRNRWLFHLAQSLPV